MKPNTLPLLNSRPSAVARISAGAVLGGCVVLLAQTVMGPSSSSARAAWPFGSADVAVVCLLSTLPLAFVAGGWMSRKFSAGVLVPLSALLLLVGAALLQLPWAPLRLGFEVRAAISLSCLLSAVLSLGVLGSDRSFWRRVAGLNCGWIAVGTAAALFALVPATYIGAHCRHDRTKLAEYLERSRFGEGRLLVQRLLVLDANQRFNDRPLPRVALELDHVIARLQSQVAVALPGGASAGERLERARALAMLGRPAQALAVLDWLDDSDIAAEADHLRGTIHENQGDWQAALACYGRARAAWDVRNPCEARTAGLMAATRGVAYCQRKAGRYADAEEEYQQLLALAPTAETHFLLAQFYEDAQHVGKARQHAKKAVELAPDRFDKPAEQLLRKLSVFHFGCLRASP